jgi:signal transduction histidine kinase
MVHARTPAASVSLRRAGERFEIEVADRGVGFNTGLIDTPGGGAGFGLFSVREQIARLGGTIEIASTPGQGTRVNLRVPVGPPEPAPTRGPTVGKP